MPWHRVLLLVLVAALLVFAGAKVHGCVKGELVQEDGQGVQEPAAPAVYEPSVQSVGSIPSGGELIEGFSLAEGDEGAPSMTESQLALVNAALANYEPNDRTVGFALLDLTSGRGYAYNVDAEVYGASTVKAPVALFACEQVDAGNLSLSSFKTYAEDAIIWSDNTSYFKLSNVVDANGYGTAFSAWLDELGIDPTLLANGSFANLSTRELMTIWMRAYLYLDESASETSAWFAGLLSDTEVSMIRAAAEGTSVFDTPALAVAAAEGLAWALQGSVVRPLASVEALDTGEANPAAGEDGAGSASSGATAAPSAESAGGGPASGAEPSGGSSAASASDLASEGETEIVVYNKAGWIAGEDYNAVNDAGIIVDGDRAYLMCIMTSAPDTDGNRTLATNLARAIWDTRDTLRV